MEVYNLAADMGGMGFIEKFRIECLRSILINTHMLEAAYQAGAERYFFSSSACAYNVELQQDPDVRALKESDAYPADAEPGYGWEKLMAELANQYSREECDLRTRIVRFHNIFGPIGTYEGGREKAPAALCRKIALAKDGEEIEIWGDGWQTRSFCYVLDCVEGLSRLMASDYFEPLNLGQDRMVTVNELVDMISEIAGKKLIKKHDLSKPQGVRGRNSDNSKLREVLKWEPTISLEKGLEETYQWIWDDLKKNGRNPS